MFLLKDPRAKRTDIESQNNAKGVVKWKENLPEMIGRTIRQGKKDLLRQIIIQKIITVKQNLII